jgi:hypothetical protein
MKAKQGKPTMTTKEEDIWRILRELSESQKDTDRRLKEVTANIGKLGNRLGEFVEESVRPAAVRLFRERGVEVHEVHQNISSKRDGEAFELDLLVVNDEDIVAIECKSNLSIDDVNEHLRRLEKLKRLLPGYANKRVFGGLAAMAVPNNVAQYAYRKGLYVIGQNGDQMEIRNDDVFVGGVW